MCHSLCQHSLHWYSSHLIPQPTTRLRLKHIKELTQRFRASQCSRGFSLGSSLSDTVWPPRFRVTNCQSSPDQHVLSQLLHLVEPSASLKSSLNFHLLWFLPWLQKTGWSILSLGPHSTFIISSSVFLSHHACYLHFSQSLVAKLQGDLENQGCWYVIHLWSSHLAKPGEFKMFYWYLSKTERKEGGVQSPSLDIHGMEKTYALLSSKVSNHILFNHAK